MCEGSAWSHLLPTSPTQNASIEVCPSGITDFLEVFTGKCAARRAPKTSSAVTSRPDPRTSSHSCRASGLRLAVLEAPSLSPPPAFLSGLWVLVCCCLCLLRRDGLLSGLPARSPLGLESEGALSALVGVQFLLVVSCAGKGHAGCAEADSQPRLLTWELTPQLEPGLDPAAAP